MSYPPLALGANYFCFTKIFFFLKALCLIGSRHTVVHIPIIYISAAKTLMNKKLFAGFPLLNLLPTKSHRPSGHPSTCSDKHTSRTCLVIRELWMTWTIFCAQNTTYKPNLYVPSYGLKLKHIEGIVFKKLHLLILITSHLRCYLHKCNKLVECENSCLSKTCPHTQSLRRLVLSLNFIEAIIYYVSSVLKI